MSSPSRIPALAALAPSSRPRPVEDGEHHLDHVELGLLDLPVQRRDRLQALCFDGQRCRQPPAHEHHRDSADGEDGSTDQRRGERPAGERVGVVQQRQQVARHRRGHESSARALRQEHRRVGDHQHAARTQRRGRAAGRGHGSRHEQDPGRRADRVQEREPLVVGQPGGERRPRQRQAAARQHHRDVAGAGR
jgi:hypothetical protein